MGTYCRRPWILGLINFYQSFLYHRSFDITKLTLKLILFLQKRGGFKGENIWANGTAMAPFDEEVR